MKKRADITHCARCGRRLEFGQAVTVNGLTYCMPKPGAKTKCFDSGVKQALLPFKSALKKAALS